MEKDWLLNALKDYPFEEAEKYHYKVEKVYRLHNYIRIRMQDIREKTSEYIDIEIDKGKLSLMHECHVATTKLCEELEGSLFNYLTEREGCPLKFAMFGKIKAEGDLPF